MYHHCISMHDIVIMYMHAGFANGNLSSVFDGSGGQCKDGLKMILDIGDPFSKHIEELLLWLIEQLLILIFRLLGIY